MTKYQPPAVRAEEIEEKYKALQKGHVNGEQVQYVPPPPDIPKEKMAEMQRYARKLMVKHPGWKLSRVQRKTAEYFNIKFSDEKISEQHPAGQASGDSE